MRKILFSVFAGGIILAGCSKSSDNSPASIVGTWKSNNIITIEYANNIKVGGDTTTAGETLVFGSDGTYTDTDSTGPSTGSYTYNSSSKVLSITTDGVTQSAHVTNLTSSDLHLNVDSSFVENGITARVTVDADYKK